MHITRYTLETLPISSVPTGYKYGPSHGASSRDAFKCRRRTIIVIINIIVSATCVTSIVSTPGGRDGVATWPEERSIEEGRRETPVFSDISVKRDDKGSREKHASRGILRIMFSDVPQKGIDGR